MRNARLVLRLAQLGLVTPSLFALWALGAVPALGLGRLARWRARIQHVWSRCVCAIAGVRLHAAGPVPRGACLVVANHLSYLDVVVLGSLFPCAFVAKSELAGWPVLGFLARSMGTIFVQRGAKRTLGALNAELRARLSAGETLVLFPEGTSTGGHSVLAFRPALLEPAAELGLPVRYATLRYATGAGERPAREVVCWWGDMQFGPHVLELLRLPTIEASVVFGPAPISASDRKTLATRLREAVLERFEPLLEHA